MRSGLGVVPFKSSETTRSIQALYIHDLCEC